MRSRASLATGLKHWEIPTRYLHACRGDPEAVTTVIAAVAKFFTVEGLRPAPPLLPILRAFHAVARRGGQELAGPQNRLDIEAHPTF